MLTLENPDQIARPEALCQTLNLSEFELMCKFCYGSGGFSKDRRNVQKVF